VKTRITKYIEPYDEELCLKRAEEMQDLPMNIMWDVFFWLMKYTKGSALGSVTFLSRQERRKLKRLQEQGLKDSDGTEASSEQQEPQPESEK